MSILDINPKTNYCNTWITPKTIIIRIAYGSRKRYKAEMARLACMLFMKHARGHQD
jgi:hypothetical protein